MQTTEASTLSFHLATATGIVFSRSLSIGDVSCILNTNHTQCLTRGECGRELTWKRRLAETCFTYSETGKDRESWCAEPSGWPHWLMSSIPEGSEMPLPTTRGKNTPPNRYDITKIQEHVERFRPQISHHRREDAPCVRYLEPELSVKILYDDFTENSAVKDRCGYDLYRRTLKEMHISFARLGKEDCSTYAVLEGADKEAHKEEASRRRKSYGRDKLRENLVYTSDLQKVSMLPRIEQFKEAAFTRRLIALNHSFVPAGGSTAETPVIANLWHEAIAGRTVTEMASSVISFLKLEELPEK